MRGYSELGIDELPEKILQQHSTQLVIVTSYPEEILPLEEMERRYVHRALAAASGNKTLAARVLGIDRRSLYRRLDRLAKKE